VAGGLAMKNKASLILRQEVEALLGQTAWLVLLHEMKTKERMRLLATNRRGIESGKEKSSVTG